MADVQATAVTSLRPEDFDFFEYIPDIKGQKPCFSTKTGHIYTGFAYHPDFSGIGSL
jgi:hypothetical protein